MYVAGQIDDKQSASDIIKSVNLLMAVRWMVVAREEVKPEEIVKRFKVTIYLQIGNFLQIWISNVKKRLLKKIK